MKIAFYAPLKSPHHPVPSGDRLMARQLMECLARAGHEIEIASELRAFLKSAEDEDGEAALLGNAQAEIDRLAAYWRHHDAPDLWFCYHPYYKAPDLIGPALCASFGIPYVTAEASYSGRRNRGVWSVFQSLVLESVGQAAVNICLTERDRAGLAEAQPDARLARLKPFIDAEPFLRVQPRPEPRRLVTVAMMRAGDKMDSYAHLAAALKQLADLPWRLSIIGDGPLREQVQTLFADFEPDRITWHGQKQQSEIADILAQSALYVWPGCGEAYGLAYLEAQATGLPVVAFNVAGVPEVVSNGLTGLLTEPGNDMGYAAAIRRLLGNEEERATMAVSARHRVTTDHSMDMAAIAMNAILMNSIGERP